MSDFYSLPTSDRKIASGGKVWIHPDQQARPWWKLNIRTMFHLLLLALILSLSYIVVQMVSQLSSRGNDFDQAYLEEYGYEDIELLHDNLAKVTVAESGEIKEVKRVEYKGVQIFYEDFEQLEERMIEADTSTS